jgi:hypothetical protein
MSSHAATKSQPRVSNDDALGDDGGDAVWGAEGIGKEINRTPEQARYLFKIGALRGAVRKVGHRTYLGSRRRLRQLAQTI